MGLDEETIEECLSPEVDDETAILINPHAGWVQVTYKHKKTIQLWLKCDILHWKHNLNVEWKVKASCYRGESSAPMAFAVVSQSIEA